MKSQTFLWWAISLMGTVYPYLQDGTYRKRLSSKGNSFICWNSKNILGLINPRNVFKKPLLKIFGTPKNHEKISPRSVILRFHYNPILPRQYFSQRTVSRSLVPALNKLEVSYFLHGSPFI